MQYSVTEEDFEGLTQEQAMIIIDVLEGRNVFVSGPAGVGKSYVIAKLCAILAKAGITYAVTATTGTAALLVEGVTIHSWSGIGVAQTVEGALSKAQYKRNNWIGVKVVVIDEVSMLSGGLFDILNQVGQVIRNSKKPFGGITMVFCGDFCQLSPVKAVGGYAFQAKTWKQSIHANHLLTKIFRQGDPTFRECLNNLRFGVVTSNLRKLLSDRIGATFEGDIQPTVIYSHKVDVNKMNRQELFKLKQPILPYKANHFVTGRGAQGNLSEKFWQNVVDKFNKDCMAPDVLHLALGAQVMLIVNKINGYGLANGSRGIVVGFSGRQYPIVKFISGTQLEIEPSTWRSRVGEDQYATREQIPLILAWAITIHKSQGCTLDCVQMQLGSDIFADGMFYTALSRARDIEGLTITTEPDYSKAKCNRTVFNFYSELEESSGTNSEEPQGD